MPSFSSFFIAFWNFFSGFRTSTTREAIEQSAYGKFPEFLVGKYVVDFTQPDPFGDVPAYQFFPLLYNTWSS